MRFGSLMVLPVWMQSKTSWACRVAMVEIWQSLWRRGESRVSSKADEVFVYAAVDLESLVLNLKEKLPLAENVAQRYAFRARSNCHPPPGSVTGAQAGGKGDQSLLCLESRSRSIRLVRNPRGIRGDQLDQIVITSRFSQRRTRVVAARERLHSPRSPFRGLRCFLPGFVRLPLAT